MELVNGQVRVFGTSQDDEIRVYDLLGLLVVYADFLPGLGVQVFSASNVSGIFIDSGDGHDLVDVSFYVTDRTTIYAGAGNDTIYGGFGDDLIYGGKEAIDRWTLGR